MNLLRNLGCVLALFFLSLPHFAYCMDSEEDLSSLVRGNVMEISSFFNYWIISLRIDCKNTDCPIKKFYLKKTLIPTTQEFLLFNQGDRIAKFEKTFQTEFKDEAELKKYYSSLSAEAKAEFKVFMRLKMSLDDEGYLAICQAMHAQEFNKKVILYYDDYFLFSLVKKLKIINPNIS